MTNPTFPYWWSKYDSYHQTDIDHEEAVELEGLSLTGRGSTSLESRLIRWDWSDEFLEGYILDGNWKDSLPFKRFGWVVGFNAKGLEAMPRYYGFWFAAGEARSLQSAVVALKSAAARAGALLKKG